jgi:peptidoglycan/LPS O-acetylase OafA/YrhL
MNAAPAKPANKMESLEAIRGLACLGAIVGHLILTFWPALYYRTGAEWHQFPAWAQTLARFPGKFVWGNLAVSIFFVLSGFVLSLSFFRGGSATSLGSAAVRRYPRLMLPMAASVALVYWLLQAGGMWNQAAVQLMIETCGHERRWLAHFNNFTPDGWAALREGTWGAFFGPAHYNRVLWTMPFELQGSFLVFAFLAVFGRLRNRWLLHGICGGLLLAWGRIHLLEFCLGMAMCDLWMHNQRTWKKSVPRPIGLALLAVALFLVPSRPVAALLVVGVPAAAPGIQALLKTRWLVFLGRVSFMLYLVHMPVVCSLGCGLYVALCRELGWPHDAGAGLAALASVVGAFVVAWVFCVLVDGPTLALTRRLDSWLFKPAADAAFPSRSGLTSLPSARAA